MTEWIRKRVLFVVPPTFDRMRLDIGTKIDRWFEKDALSTIGNGNKKFTISWFARNFTKSQAPMGYLTTTYFLKFF